MRCILCDRCNKIVEDERKIKIVTYARPLTTNSKAKCLPRADERSMNDHIWTKEICPSCAEKFEGFMDSDETPVEPPAELPNENPDDKRDSENQSGDGDNDETGK